MTRHEESHSLVKISTGTHGLDERMNRKRNAITAIALATAALPHVTASARAQTAAADPMASAAPAVVYDVAFPNAAHHEARITMVLPAVPPGPLELTMARSSPGRYALHEFV